MQRISMRP